MSVGWALALGGLGAIFGSFIAALVIRWPAGRSVLQGRSACDACERTLSPLELVPIVSFLAQRGRCRACGARIEPTHLWIELAAVAIGAAAGAVAPGWGGIAGATFGWLLLALAALDIVALWLPDRLTALLAAAGLASGLTDLPPGWTDRLIGGGAGYGALAAIAWGYKAWRGHDGMGGGDPKLFGAIGLWLGWRMLPAVLVIASLVGLGVALFARVTGRAIARDTALPFGALLGVAAYPAWLAMVGWAP
ncbi:prepilin peptidase [Sphingomonas sp. RIT328]|uniref:prepilin peptidase n=1 Tax=Sphingomonas sp. RIT328 TaxID=1470591 RepID=UPI00044DECBA|nr:A24 family peptidase [Sphingomonas sp. RIT328]EZP55325.1 Type 4 prepilin-like proteins leader peptide-processing enzyme [Sphingomonas sp. RIT328]